VRCTVQNAVERRLLPRQCGALNAAEQSEREIISKLVGSIV
jgi:hypothetical protein